MADDAAVSEFLEETCGILSGLSGTCSRDAAPAAFAAGVPALERGLHTIKGNAAAFGFQELSSAASDSLDWLRTQQRSGVPLEKPDDILPVLDFLERLRRYLALLKRGTTLPPGFFSSLMLSQAPPAETAPKVVQRPGKTALVAPVSQPDWDREAKQILSQAPLVEPKIDRIVWMAIHKLTGKGEVPPQDEVEEQRPPAPARIETARGSGRLPDPGSAAVERVPAVAITAAPPPRSLEALHAYAVEAVAKAGWLRSVQEKCQGASWLAAALCEVSDVLSSFARWSVEARATPLAGFLGDLGTVEPEPGASVAGSGSTVTEGQVLVVPAVGKLLRALVVEALRATPSGRKSASAPAVSISTSRADGFFKLCIRGVRGLGRPHSKLQLDLLKQRVERCGVSVSRSSEAGAESELSISVPDGFDGMEALIVRAGDDRIGLPLHRVHAVLEPGQGDLDHGGEAETAVPLDLAPARGEESGQRRVVIVRTEKGTRALKVGEVLRKEEMIVTGPGGEGLTGDGFSLALSLRTLEWMPFLWCSARLFEPLENLVSAGVST